MELQCNQVDGWLGAPPKIPVIFGAYVYKRPQSDRFEAGTQPILIKNAKIWTGDLNGTEVVNADVLLDKGIIQGIGRVEQAQLKAFKDELVVIDAKGALVTPGYVCTCVSLVTISDS